MAVSFSLHLIPDDLHTLVQRARFAEDAGFEQLWIAESHLTCRDVYIALALCVLDTSRIKLGPGVTNPIFRDNSVTASAIATLAEVAPGRALLGLGSGDTPVYMLGKKLASLATLRRAVTQIRGLLRGEAVDYGGVRVALPWSRQNVPIYLAAEGPKTLQLAAEVADGVIVGSGVLPQTVQWAQEHLRLGLQRRDPALGELEVTFAAMCSVERDGRVARERVRPRVANRAHHNFRLTLESVPPEHRPEVERLLQNFDVTDWRSPKHTPLITDYLLDRFAIAGTPAQCIERIRQLEGLGVRRIMIDPPSQDFDASLKMFAEKVMPYV